VGVVATYKGQDYHTTLAIHHGGEHVIKREPVFKALPPMHGRPLDRCHHLAAGHLKDCHRVQGWGRLVRKVGTNQNSLHTYESDHFHTTVSYETNGTYAIHRKPKAQAS